MPPPVAPFLKWAGGKRWLAERHLSMFPSATSRYIEPFLGSASIFFSLRPRVAFLSDANPRLIECYEQIRDESEAVQGLLTEHQRLHSTEHYYFVRSTKYETAAERAAQFLYLNRTCWNGLYRVNKRGEFNVPKGTKNSVVLPNDDFFAVSKVLKVAKISCCDFETALAEAKSDDLVYVDPPYTVQHNFNGFLKYNENIFSWSDQVRLRDAVIFAASKGARVVVSNAAHSSVIDLYAGIGETHFVKRNSVLAASSARRGEVDEIMVII
nr:Dam family site-specific DNA-(adenine-N6)-methyltransferase [Neorhizobium galegae]